jgi:hypothetical protein
MRVESPRSDLPRGRGPRRDATAREARKARAAAAAAWFPRQKRPALNAAKAAVALLALGLAFGIAADRLLGGGTISRPAPLELRAAAPEEPALPLEAPSRLFVGVQVNARPWAQIRVDGRDVGATPLRVPLPPGAYDFEAALPDGQTLQRRVEIGPAQRFVAFP